MTRFRLLRRRKEKWCDQIWNYSRGSGSPIPIYFFGAIFWCLIIFIIVSTFKRHSSGIAEYDSLQNVAVSRSLLSVVATENMVVYDSYCNVENTTGNQSSGHTPPAWETCDMEKSTNMLGGWLTLYVICTLIIFVALAIICDDFFVPSLEAISEKLNLSEDVAGATFMAAGSSAPELFSSIAAVTFNSDVGVGTITGSAVFNLLVIVALTAAFAGTTLHLDWRPLTRDSFFYCISIGFFIYSAWDTQFQYWEAIIMLVIYAIYLVVMVFNKRLMDAMERFGNRCSKTKVDPATLEEDVEENDLNESDPKRLNQSQASIRSTDSKKFQRNRRKSIVYQLASSLGRTNSIVPLPEESSPVKMNSLAEMKSQTRMDSGFQSPDHSERSKDGDPEARKMPPDAVFNTEGQQEIPSQPRRESGTNEHPEIAKSSSSVRSVKSKQEKEDQDEKKEALSKVSEKVNNDKNEEEVVQTEKVASQNDDNEVKEEEEDDDPRIECCCQCCPPIRGAPPQLNMDQDGNPHAIRCIFALKWILFVIAFPFLVFFSYTIPECSKPHNKKWFLVSFLMSVLWIAGLSFAMVTIVSRAGCLLEVDSYVMSLVILAAGTSIPDLLSSIIVARDGFGDMAVSNAIGSNVFDMNLGMGLPFLIRMVIELGKPFDVFNANERAAYCEHRMFFMPHPKFGFILLALVGIALSVFGVVRFRLTKILGCIFFLLYIGFLVYAFVQEFVCNKTGYFNC